MIQNIIALYIEDVNVITKKSGATPCRSAFTVVRRLRTHLVRVAVAVSPSHSTAVPSASAMARTGR